ncbi:hypothetical protein C8039_18215 [Halogeometricum sp. wsp3]|nr:hypothetical protein C8039_18215 [Halogeometricum sp. wsp3]
MDDDGRMELRDVEADETYEVVDYIDSELATKLRSLSAGDAVSLELLSGSVSDMGEAAESNLVDTSARFSVAGAVAERESRLFSGGLFVVTSQCSVVAREPNGF